MLGGEQNSFSVRAGEKSTKPPAHVARWSLRIPRASLVAILSKIEQLIALLCLDFGRLAKATYNIFKLAILPQRQFAMRRFHVALLFPSKLQYLANTG
jgi:hypothetical protein